MPRSYVRVEPTAGRAASALSSSGTPSRHSHVASLTANAVASGAACASGSTEPSHVLLGMGIAPEVGLGSIRFSLGVGTSPEQIDRVLALLPETVERVRGASGV